MSETNEPKYSDYAGHTTGVFHYCDEPTWIHAPDYSLIADFGERGGLTAAEAIANAALFVAAADPLIGYVATLAKLAAAEQERDDWERRAFAAGEELAEVRADRADWKRVAAIWRDKRLVKYGLKPRDDAPEVTA